MKLYTFDGQPVEFGLSLVTEPGEGWKGQRFIGEYRTVEELSKAINAVEVPVYWQLQIDIRDAQ